MFKFVPDAHSDGARLVADTVLTLEQFEGIAKELGTPPIHARKSGFVASTSEHDQHGFGHASVTIPAGRSGPYGHAQQTKG